MAESRSYDREYKVQAVKLAKEIGQAKAAQELGVPKNTLYGWMRASRQGDLDLGAGTQTPESAMTLNEELKTAAAADKGAGKGDTAFKERK